MEIDIRKSIQSENFHINIGDESIVEIKIVKGDAKHKCAKKTKCIIKFNT